MSKWNLIVDVARCENCRNCSLAAKDEHVDNDFPGYAAPQELHGPDWIRIERHVRGEGTMVEANYLPRMCNHCDNPPCQAAAGEDVVKKREDGIVIIDPVKAKGRRDIVESCPYGAITWNESLQLPQIWIFDAHLLDQGWAAPRCAQSCPTATFRALKVEDERMQAIARSEELAVLEPELGTKPRVYYRNLHLVQSCFLAGSVVADIDGREECVEGARVTLGRNGETLATTETDTFGDFKFDGLSAAGGDYQVDIEHRQHGRTSLREALSASRYVEAIRLTGD